MDCKNAQFTLCRNNQNVYFLRLNFGNLAIGLEQNSLVQNSPLAFVPTYKYDIGIQIELNLSILSFHLFSISSMSPTCMFCAKHSISPISLALWKILPQNMLA